MAAAALIFGSFLGFFAAIAGWLFLSLSAFELFQLYVLVSLAPMMTRHIICAARQVGRVTGVYAPA